MGINRDNNTIDYYGYGISPSFDGIDLSRWLIYGDENDNPRRNVGLSINDWNSTSINNYQGTAEYCTFCIDDFTGDRYRCQDNAQLFDRQILFDLTIDFNETTNIYQSVLKTNNNQLKEFIKINNKTSEYLKKKKLKLLQLRSLTNNTNNTNNNYNSKKRKQNDVTKKTYFKLNKEIDDIWDYFVYGDSSALTEALWQEGKRIAIEYTQNSFYNSYYDCQTEIFSNAASPAYFNGAWTPWWDFDEYSRRMETWCGDDLNHVLMDLYTTKYDQDQYALS